MTYKRVSPITARAADQDARTVEMAISSELPYERWFGIEILDHKASSVDLSRLKDNRHPLLLEHDWEKQIGVVREPVLGDDQMLRVQAKFSQSQLGQEIFQDVQDEIRSLVSVGYEIIDIQEETRGEDGEIEIRKLSGEEFKREMTEKYGADFYRAGPPATRGKDAPPVYRVTRWVPFEASIVPIPADPSVGIGRAGGPASIEPAASDQAIGVAEITTHEEAKRQGAQSLIILKEYQMTIEKSPAELDIERRDAIMALGEAYPQYVGQKDIADACRNGKSVDQFKDLIMTKMESKHTDTGIQLGMNKKEAQRYSFGRALVAAVSGDWREAGFERECSEAVSKIMGRQPEGFYVPYDVWRRDFNVGTASEAGNLVATDLRGDLFADVFRNKMVLGQLGARILTGLSGNVDIPLKTTAGTVAMLTEIGSATETAPVTAKRTLSPKRVGAYVEVSKQALIQSALALENMIRDDLLMGSAVLLESQAINGAGTGAEMTGIRNTSSIGTVAGGTNGLAPAWSHFVDLESACANSNAEPDTLAGYLINTKVRGKLKQTQFGTNLPFIWQNSAQPLNGYRAAVSNNVPSNLTKGTSTTVCSASIFGSDWSEGIIGLFGAPDVTVDPYTKADTGQVKITLNQFADFKVRQNAAFAKIEDLLAG